MMLAFIAPEELKAGEKYFKILKKILFVLIAAAFIYFTKEFGLILTGVSIIASALCYIFLLDRPYIYLPLAVVFSISFMDIGFLIIISSLIFLFGLPYGTLYTKEMIKDKKIVIIGRMILSHLMFFILALPLYFFNL
jgi:hypothetical protein